MGMEQMRNGKACDFDATAGNVWIADLIHFLQWEAKHSEVRTGMARVFQNYDYSKQEFRESPVIVPVRLVLDSRDRMIFYVRDTRVSYDRFYKIITS
jgi:hypothetical protein